jgi:tetratricopeptide (TPR) repeat protein
MRVEQNVRFVYVLVAAACVLSFVSACSSGSKPKPAATGGVDAKTSAAANDAVTKGLQAHAAGRLDEAAADYRQALALDPRNKFAVFNLGVIDQSQGRADSAENNYRLALQIDPNFTSALFNLAILRTAAGSTQEAIQLYRRVIAAEPNNAASHLNLGFLLLQTGQQADGNAELALAVQLDPNLAPRIVLTPTPTR